MIYIFNLDLHLNIFFLWRFQSKTSSHLCLDFNIGRILFHVDINLLCGRKFISERSQVRSEEHTMSPASLFAPELAEMVGNGIVGRLVQGLVGTLCKFVVSLGDLPHYHQRSENHHSPLNRS